MGREAGRGFTVNVPLEVGSVDDDYQLVFERIVVPVVRQFEPDLIIASAGFDAHERDPLGGMRLSTPAFAAMTLTLRGLADECCRGRLVSVTEGGYDLQALAASLDAIIDAHAAAAYPRRCPGRRPAELPSADWPPFEAVRQEQRVLLAVLSPEAAKIRTTITVRNSPTR